MCQFLMLHTYFFVFQCVLASIIVVALKGMLMQVKQCVQFWKMSHLDAIVWLGTFLTVVIVSIDIGLAVGILLSLACIFIRGMKPYTCLLGHVPKTDLYVDVKRYKAVSVLDSHTHTVLMEQLKFIAKKISHLYFCRLKRSIRLKYFIIVVV